MFYVLQNEAVAARKRCPILLTDSATGTTGQSGLALSTIYPYVSINGGAFAGGAGTIGAVNFGQYYYEFDASEINTLGLAGIHITAPGCRDYDAIVQVAAFNMYSAAGAGLTAGDVWSYGGGRTTTGGIANTVTNPVDVTTASMTGIANTTWDTDVSAFTSPSAGYDLTQAATGGAGISAADVWNYVLSDTNTADANLTTIAYDVSQIDVKTTDIDSHTQATWIATSVWNENLGSGPNSPYGAGSAGTILYDLSLGGGSGISAADVWSYSDRTITGGAVTSVTDPVSVSTASMSGIANTVWNTDVSAFTSPSAGYDLTQAASGGAGISAADVWNYTMSNSQTADYNVVTTLNNTDTIINQHYPISDIWQYDISSFTDPSAGFNLYQLGIGATGYAAGGGLTAGDVWEYDISAISTAGTAGSQLNLAASPSGSGLTAGDVWDFVITGFGQTGSAALYATQTNFTVGNIETYVQNQTPQDIWSYAGIEGRTITGGIADTVTSVTNPISVSTVSMSGIANTVWNTDISAISTAGTAGSQLNLAASPSGSGITAGEVADAVWNAATSSYTTSGTFGHNTLRSDVAGVAGTVSLWTGGAFSGVYADAYRIDESYVAATALKDVLTGIGASITGNITGDLSGSVGSVTNDVSLSTATQASIANSVWITDVSSYVSPSAGYDLSNATAGGGITAGDVWSYATREITGGIADTVTTVSGNVLGSVNSVVTDVTLSAGTQASIANSVWSTDVSGYTSPSAGFDLSNASSGAGLTAGDVWTYATREITGGIADTVTTLTNRSGFAITGGTVDTVTNGVTVTTNNDKTGYSLSSTQTFDVTGNITGNVSGSVGSVTADVNVSTSSMTGIAGTVWSTDISGYTSPSAGFDLANASSGSGLTAFDVWSYATRTITGGIADTVTTVSTGVTVTTNNDKTGYDLSSTQTFDLTGNITGNLSGSVGSVTADVNVSTASMTGIAGTVWNYATRTLTSTGAGISAYDVWNFDPTAMTSPQAGAILTDIQTDTNTIITDIGNIPNNVWASDVSGYSTPGEAGFELTQAASGAGLTAGDVWTYGTRTITGGIADTVTTITNRAGFAITGGTITTVSDKTGYSLSGSQTFNMTGNITGNVSGTVGSVSGAVGSVVGNVGGNVVGSVDSVTNPVTFSSGQYAAIASSVWNAGTRTLTSGAGATAGDVWTYATRTLTSGAGITVNAATNIINGPYFVKSNVDGQDGTLDVIRGMVQDIQLTVTDAFQNPFDTTALGLAVNFYDQAGTLTTSYATTELYGPAGLVQFTLDTAVTANEGRYNLILSAAGAGNTIKFGPLQTLVRPF